MFVTCTHEEVKYTALSTVYWHCNRSTETLLMDLSSEIAEMNEIPERAEIDTMMQTDCLEETP